MKKILPILAVVGTAAVVTFIGAEAASAADAGGRAAVTLGRAYLGRA